MQSAFRFEKALVFTWQCGDLSISKATEKPNAEKIFCAFDLVLLNRAFAVNVGQLLET